ncbi:MAG: peptidoglycan-binding protein [Clostridia bacterium]|nr:peptidoglycan-binding protein [Clostridia bacterium]
MKNKNMKRLAVLALVCVMVMVSAVAFAASYSKVYGQTQDKIRVRESASTNAAVIDNIVKNACVYVTSSKTSGSSTFVQIRYRASDGMIDTGWVCQSDGKNTYVKILSAEQAKKQFSVSGGNLPSKKVGTFTAAQRAVSEKATDSTYIRLGSSGATVKSMQTKLKALNMYTGEITGNAGEKTVAAIKAFQKKHGLTADGIAGPQTIAKIDAVYAAQGGSQSSSTSSSTSSSSSSTASGLKLGSTGTDVRNLQADLTTLGYYWADITGNFGAKTEAAVKSFQKDKGLTADGVAGAKTIAALANAIAKKGNTGSTSTGSVSSGTALKLNSKGDKVSQLQRDLTTLKYYYADITGNFGAKTEAAVKAFQKDKGLTADGVAGTKTLDAIEAALKKSGSSSNSSSGSSSSSSAGLKLGSTSESVRNLQKDLTTLGFYYGDITGHFGTMTEKAVEKFQKSRGMTQDGVAGDKTLAAIASALKSTGNSSASSSGSADGALREGDSGTAVTELQTMLKKLGYYYGDITGNFGDLTRKAVRAFQDKENLTVDGIAGSATMNKLRKLTGSSSSSSTGTSSGSAVTAADSYGRVTKDNVNLRSAASTTSSAKASLKKGTLLRITATKTADGMKWYYVSVKEGKYTYKGYIRSDMMETITEAEYNKAGGDSSSNYGDMETLGMIKVTGDDVALRYSPDKNAAKVGSADKGDTFYYIDTVSGWFQTKAGYWISSSYAKVLKDDEMDDYISSDGSDDSYQLYSTGSTVLFIQTALDTLGYYKGELTGHYGPKTEAAVKSFQKDNGLNNDGVVGSKTLAKLSEKYYAKIGNTAVGTYQATIYNISWPTEYNDTFKKLGFVRGNEKATLTDIATGLTFSIYVQSTNKNHADVEPLTASDTATMCRIYGVSTSSKIPWNRRAMVLTIGKYQFVCSIYGEEHGQDDKPNNNYSGQFCVHFKDSNINSGDGGSVSDDKNHQAIIKNAVTTLKNKEVTMEDGTKKKITVTEVPPTL